jgi:hypothetical protein
VPPSASPSEQSAWQRSHVRTYLAHLVLCHGPRDITFVLEYEEAGARKSLREREVVLAEHTRKHTKAIE